MGHCCALGGESMITHATSRYVRWAVVLIGCSAAFAAFADGQQFDIVGPAGSVSFGASVAVLPNGNIVIADPDGVASGVGAVYLYARNGTLISSITGSSANDHVGSGGIVVLKNGDFVFLSPKWHNDTTADAGAVTWSDGTSGISGVVTSGNSLVGSTQGDAVGATGSVTALANGNYVVATSTWNDPAPVAAVGAVTFASGSTGIVGAVSSSNSLVGSQANDSVGVGGVTALPNGNYVVLSYLWNNGATTQAGAVTHGNGATGIAGAVSPANSLVGSSAGDFVGVTSVYFPGIGNPIGTSSITVLPNSNYVVASSLWANGALSEAGAATFVNGASGLTGTLSSANSLIGPHAGDHIGSTGVEVLSNSNYVVASPDCANVSVQKAGAATWGNGATGLSGIVGPGNSLVGTQANDAVSGGPVIEGHNVRALTDGNYVVISSSWANGANSAAGAVTWRSGTSPQPGIVSPANSLVGSSANDTVGWAGVFALPSGDYVVGSPHWNNGALASVGAETLLRGGHLTSASVTAANSLVGSTANDQVGFAVTALTNGNFVVDSLLWQNAGGHVGASTWVNNSLGLTGPVTTSNSLIGTTDNDQVGYAVALSNGNYVVDSGFWSGYTGAVTWGNGVVGTTGVVSAANSLVGTQANDYVGFRNTIPVPGGFYIVENTNWSNGGALQAGAISLGKGKGSTRGPVTSANSVVGNVASGGARLVSTYDVTHATLIVGKPAENIVTQFTYGDPTDILFANDFE
jgi:hypothetical protein